MPSEGIQGDEWAAYVALICTARTNVGSPVGREPYGDGVPVVVAGVTPGPGQRRLPPTGANWPESAGRPEGAGVEGAGPEGTGVVAAGLDGTGVASVGPDGSTGSDPGWSAVFDEVDVAIGFLRL
jgi:hypothetical protein